MPRGGTSRPQARKSGCIRDWLSNDHVGGPSAIIARLRTDLSIVPPHQRFRSPSTDSGRWARGVPALGRVITPDPIEKDNRP